VDEQQVLTLLRHVDPHVLLEPPQDVIHAVMKIEEIPVDLQLMLAAALGHVERVNAVETI